MQWLAECSVAALREALGAVAWHLRHALGDVLWRSEAGLPLADHRTPPEWVQDLAARFSALGIDPESTTPAANQR